MSDYSRLCTLVVAIAVAVLASACGPSAPPTAALMPSGVVDLKTGTYALSYPLLDLPGKPFPRVVIAVPDGWTINNGLAVQTRIDTPRQLAVAFWDVVDVYANGCHWLGPKIHPGPTVDELAACSRPDRSGMRRRRWRSASADTTGSTWSGQSPLTLSSRTAIRAPTTRTVGSRAGQVMERAERIDTSWVQARSTGCGSSTSRAAAW